ncbi:MULTISPECIES: helix-turn-helix domain-containing protein [unclassified Streptomyces]|uniref:helix-turn-helix domain-containing protein n=1 Tax=unclassified Streptomyces TaxID=2593676 RepID=UPI00166188CA|nr:MULTISPECIES: helix-turn-helix domain-containing protein [unclassified Streptomyces]MBD0711615.1 hypothetical protein [Streptomyces sp. CBMA291]MBD0714812.1 hypothetical protein [Streptomyces sp. CBMA370]
MVDLRTAARALGICTGTAYRLIHKGTFPCQVLRVGGLYRVPTTALLRVLDIEEQPLYAVDLEAGLRGEEDGESEEDDGMLF